MYTSIVLVALVSSADAKGLAWHSDYSVAQKLCATEKKPMAVILGNGPSGAAAVNQNGKFDPSVNETLQAQYVCVYVDVTTERGQKLAEAFEMKNGLVISDRTGEKQAFRHEGTLTNSDLDSVLKRFSDPERVVTRTETNGRTETRNYPYESSTVPSYLAPASGGYCPSCRGR